MPATSTPPAPRRQSATLLHPLVGARASSSHRPLCGDHTTLPRSARRAEPRQANVHANRQRTQLPRWLDRMSGRPSRGRRPTRRRSTEAGTCGAWHASDRQSDPIAHGYVTLSLCRMSTTRSSSSTASPSRSTGRDTKSLFRRRCRSRRRPRAAPKVKEVQDIAGGAQVVFEASFEREGTESPSAVAETVVRVYTG
jgi:hypothetical protein